MTSLFLERLRLHAARAPDHAAIATPDLTTGYGELVGRVEACARSLDAQGVARGEIASSCFPSESSVSSPVLQLERRSADRH